MASHSPFRPSQFGRAIFQQLDRYFNLVFGSKLNPLCHLGSLGFLFFWIIAVSGIYLYAMLDTSVAQAYNSINNLSLNQWYLGGLLRSLHRYSADAFILVMVIHLIREWAFGHFRGFRRFSWLTGIPLLLFAFACGIGGFWLSWDQLGQFSAQATADWLDGIPIFASSLTRNFLNVNSVNDRLFSLFVFIHLGLPLLLLFGLWFHIQRISIADVFPPRVLAGATLVMLLVISIVKPVLSHPAADLGHIPAMLSIDWIMLFAFPFMYATSSYLLSGVLTVILAILFLLPFFPRNSTTPLATVDPDNCNGCRRCFDDCPYAAISMVPHPNSRFKQLARVDPDLCASCGICVGSCPSSTPFRSVKKLVTGIDLPHLPISTLRQQLKKSLRNADSEKRIIIFGCDHGARVNLLQDPNITAFSLPCIGMLPPSFIEYALRDGAAGVLISGCQSNNCEFRLGQKWMEERIEGVREPHFRTTDSRMKKVGFSWANAGEEIALTNALEEFKNTIVPLNQFNSLSETSRNG